MNTGAYRGVISAIVRFASLYESFQALTSIQVSHFVEWFSGDDIDSIWTKTDVAGTNTFAMADEIDGGFKITTGSTTNDRGTINFNNKRHYDPRASILICIVKTDGTSNSVTDVGMAEDATDFPSSTDRIISRLELGNTTIFLTTSDGTVTNTDTGVAISSNFVGLKFENGSANAKLFIDGVLKATGTTNRPTIALEPVFSVKTLTGSAKFGQIRYLEVFNTSVSILSSLYERLSALTQVMGQRVVENFVGSVLNERWQTNNVQGTNTFQMADVIDGGFEIITGTTTNDDGSINFNNKRQYDFNASIIIFVMKQITATSYRCQAGFTDSNNLPSGDSAYIDNNTDFTNYRLLTFNNGSGTATSLGVALDQLEHSFKVETKVSSVEGSMDGVLKATNTTNLPDEKMQPGFEVITLAAAAKTGRIRYLEAYNKLTTETDHPSVYELFNPLTTIAKQHFWDWFDGNDKRNWWTFVNISGIGSSAMVDAVDEGFGVTSGASNAQRSAINFNAKRTFSNTDSVVIAVMRRVSSLSIALVGLVEANEPISGSASADWRDDTNRTFKSLVTLDSTSLTITDSDVAIDTVFTSYKIEVKSADTKGFINGVLKVTNTTNLPDFRMQPIFMSQTRTSAVQESRARPF